MGDVYEDFEEDDVWAVMRERKERNRKGRGAKEPKSPAPRCLPTVTARKIPTCAAHADASGSGGDGEEFQRSAPVSIPDWSKIYGRKGSPEGNSHKVATDLDYPQDDCKATSTLDVGDDDEEEDSMLPPHEWLARKLATSQISSFSVCEGVGRTLKGRDLSRVRNAVLSRTGFLE